MIFVHEDPEFLDLLQQAASTNGLSISLIEKDYWVTHALWALQEAGYEIWFKGGTSLSKGFDLIHRFSEDLDLKVNPGHSVLPHVGAWKKRGKSAIEARRRFFAALAKDYKVPGARVLLGEGGEDSSWRSANLHVLYPGMQRDKLPPDMKPYVLLEVGDARVVPAVERDITSFVHVELARLGQAGGFRGNLPKALRCVHPLVTLLEKIDALHRRVPGNDEPAKFVRHYEDAARIILAEPGLPPLEGYKNVRLLAAEMYDAGQLRSLPAASDPALLSSGNERSGAIRQAYDRIAPLFWGERIPFDEACELIRRWAEKHFP